MRHKVSKAHDGVRYLTWLHQDLQDKRLGAAVPRPGETRTQAGWQGLGVAAEGGDRETVRREDEGFQVSQWLAHVP